jgi:hypothetical protein
MIKFTVIGTKGGVGRPRFRQFGALLAELGLRVL